MYDVDFAIRVLARKGFVVVHTDKVDEMKEVLNGLNVFYGTEGYDDDSNVIKFTLVE